MSGLLPAGPGAAGQLPGPGPDRAPEVPTPKAFATFGELTQLAGVFSFVERVDMLADYTAVCIDEFELADQNVALRLVSLTDRLYDAGIPVVASGAKLDSIFSEEMLAGGYRMKYLRATSRPVALTAGVTQPGEP